MARTEAKGNRKVLVLGFGVAVIVESKGKQAKKAIARKACEPAQSSRLHGSGAPGIRVHFFPKIVRTIPSKMPRTAGSFFQPLTS